MHEYRVVERWRHGNRLGLRCQTGCYHLARALDGLPGVEATLNGDKPHLGFCMLSRTQSDRIYRVIFESINHAVPAVALEVM